MKTAINRLLGCLGLRLERVMPRYLPAEFISDYERVRSLTMVDWAGAYAAWTAAGYVVEHNIPGDLVECGVWRGGISILMARRLMDLGATDRRLWLYDTFEGMPEPGDKDRDKYGVSARRQLDTLSQADEANDVWAFASREAVERNLRASGVDPSACVLVQGPVEQTIPGVAPEQVAVCRLDTDWYESTRHELEHLYPRLSTGGILLIDDYHYWQGCHHAVDEYFASIPRPPYFSTLSNASLAAVKL